jgi:uncharacterized protein YjbI with pentapeptide repeats
MPSFDDDEPLGVAFFRTLVENNDFSGLTLPRTFFGRSEVRSTSFRNTDLHESRMCWCDFVEIDFSGADLTNSDLRASVFTNCNFANAQLAGADLRHATFEDCAMSNAMLIGAKLARLQTDLMLAEAQRGVVDWHDDSGEEPPGG